MSAQNAYCFALEKLPKEILLEISTYLKSSDIKVLSTVSKGMNDFVSNNVSTLRKLILKLDSDSEGKLKEAKEELARYYAHVHFSFTDFSKNTGLWLTSNYCSKLRDLEITYMNFKISDAKLFKKSFQSLHQLEKLTMLECDIDGYENSMQATIEPVEIPSLKSIDMFCTHLGFLLLMKTPNVHSLKLGSKGDLESSAIITKFLQGLSKLDRLALWKIDFEDFEEIGKDQLATINSPLRNLSLRNLKNPFKSDENLLEFLNRFASTLVELEMGKFPALPDSAYEIIFNKFHHLKVLRVCLESAPKEAEFYARLQSNPSIKKLIIDPHCIEKQAFFGIISKLPNLETLIINTEITSKDILQYVATNSTNLKTLSIKKIAGLPHSLKNVRFPFLKNLIFCELKLINTESWKLFVKSFKNIESLSIHKTDSASFDSRTFNIFTKGLVQIKHFMFGQGLEGVKRIFNQMIKNCKDLQTIEVFQNCLADAYLLDKVHRDITKPGFRLIAYSEGLANICEKFDNHGPFFWKTDENFDDQESEDDSSFDSDDAEDSDYDLDDSDDGLGLGGLIGALARAAHGPGGVPWYDSDSGEQQMGRFDSDGEWEPWEPEYYLD